MFESQSKKEPKLVFSHKSQQSSPKASSIQVTKIPRVALAGVIPAGQPDQTNSDPKRNDVVVNNSRPPQHGRQPEERLTVAQRSGTPREQGKNSSDNLKSPNVVSAISRENHEGQRNSPLSNTQRYQHDEVRMGDLALKDDVDYSKTKLDNNNDELMKNNNEVQPNGQKDNILYKDIVYTGIPVTSVVKTMNEGNSTVTESNSNRFEGFSIYRGARESHEFDRGGGTLSKSATNGHSKTTEVNQIEKVSVTESAAATLHKSESDSVMLRHPGSNVRAGTEPPIPQPYQTVQLPRQQYSMSEHEYQYGTTSSGQNRQMDYRYIAVPQGRVKSYPQASHQVPPKAFRLVGSVMAEPVYTPVKVRTVSGKQRPNSYTVSPKYAVPVTWQVGAPVGYATLMPDRRVVVVKQRSNSISPRGPYQEQEPPSPKPTPPVSNTRPKSILKNQTQLEAAPEWHQNVRAMHIPRAQSIKNPSASADQNYDFSHILTANSDTVSYSKNKLDDTDASARPDTPDSVTSKKDESGQQGAAPSKKSVKFNSQVRLHTEDDTLDVVGLLAPT